MVGSKRFIRHGLVISALGHVGLLAIGLILAWGSAREAAPPEAVPPDATLVELVTPKEIPRFSGTPSELRISGTETAAQSQAAIPMKEPPQPKEQRQAQRNAASKPHEPQTAPPQTRAPPMAQAEAGEVAMPKPPAPAAEETPDASDTEARLAQLALMGGRLGGGFAAPPIDSPLVGYDFTLAFRERVSACTARPPGIAPTEKINITTRVFLNRDGTLAAPPQLLEPHPSAKQEALMQSFASGLKECQPYTMLPPDRYKEWKTLDLLVYPLNAFGG